MTPQGEQAQYPGRGRKFLKIGISFRLATFPLEGLAGISETELRISYLQVARSSLLPGLREGRVPSLSAAPSKRVHRVGEAGVGLRQGRAGSISIWCSRRNRGPRGGRGTARLCRAADSSHCSPGTPRGLSFPVPAGAS